MDGGGHIILVGTAMDVMDGTTGNEGTWGMNDNGGPKPEGIVEDARPVAESYELLEKGGRLSRTVGRSDLSIASLSSLVTSSLCVRGGIGK